MEKMPYQSQLEDIRFRSAVDDAVISSEWKSGLPALCGQRVVLREMRLSDAPALCALLTSEEVARFISPPPSTVEGFERFIGWTLQQRRAGAHACFAVTLKDSDIAIGLFQVRGLDSGLDNGEWGFAIGSEYWGTGVFEESAKLVVNFAFDTIGIHRLEARSAIRNGRGNGALRKLGAVREGTLRQSFLKNGEYLDQALWAILAEDWRGTTTVWEGRIH